MILNLSKHEDWKLINYRVIDDLITAEFLHDLYNRHLPEINSIRFRNTVCVLRDNQFMSYAPKKEWEILGQILGTRLLNNERNLHGKIYTYINKPKENLELILKDLSTENYIEVKSKEELYYLLLELHYISLGEIYGINLVQIEHGINWALSEYCTKYNINLSDLDGLYGKNQKTIGVEADLYLTELALKVKKNEISINSAIEYYTERFGHITNGYGSFEGTSIETKLNEKLEKNIDYLESKLLKNNSEVERRKSFTPNKGIINLISLAHEIAMLRDRNKALMGKVSHYRNLILNKIAFLNAISREELKRYKLSELFDLTYYDKRVSSEEINTRKNLVVFNRNESFATGEQAELLEECTIKIEHTPNQAVINGICASKGIVRGFVKHIQENYDEIGKNDILVALGTDFNFMDAMINSAGIITQEGGILSHASVVSRELGKPCLIGVENIFNKLPNGSYIELDATNEVIRILELPNYESSVQRFRELDDVLNPLEVGNKIYRLSECNKSGFNVLPGIVISHKDLKNLDLDTIAETIHTQSLKFSFNSTYLILRSSSLDEDQSYSSVAGIYESVTSLNNVNSIKLSILKILGSANNERVSKYFGKNTDKKMSLLIQPFLKQEIGGVIFTNNPMNVREMLVELSYKGAKAVVNGEVDKTIQLTRESDDESLDEFLVTIKRKALEIESCFGFPCDIEWGLANNEIYIFQVRPITAIYSKS